MAYKIKEICDVIFRKYNWAYPEWVHLAYIEFLCSFVGTNPVMTKRICRMCCHNVIPAPRSAEDKIIFESPIFKRKKARNENENEKKFFKKCEMK